MKKFFSLMMIAALAFVGCGGNEDVTPGEETQLDTPVVEIVDVEAYGFTVTWAAVKGADSYTVNMKGDNYTTTETSYKFENLNAGEYQVRVKATGKGYKDSKFGSATATLKGATEVDWFTQTFTLPETEIPEEGINRCNTAYFSWKGTGVKDIAYGLFATAGLEGVDDATIIANLNSLPSDQQGTILDEVNGDGFEGQFAGMLSGGTSYTLCVQATNAAGLKFFTKNELTTDTAEASDAAKAWLGTWSVTSHKIYTIDGSGNGVLSDKEETFTVTVESSTNDPNEVLVYNHTMLGADAWPAVGQIIDGQLYLMNGVNLGASQDGSFYYMWLGWYDFGDGKTVPSIDSIPFAIVAQEDGKVVSSNVFDLYDQNQNAVTVTCHACDIFGVSDAGNIYFLGIEAFPAVYRSGVMDWVKTEATPSAKALSFEAKNPTALKSNVVVR